MEKSDAIKSLSPNITFSMEGDEIVSWKSDKPQPTDAEIDAEIIRLQAEYDVQAYSRNRQAEYPSVQECVHAILDDTLDALQAKRASVKLKYPKGG